MKLYHGIIWQSDDTPGHHVTVMAENLADARKILEAEHGKGKVFDLHNKEDAEKPR